MPQSSRLMMLAAAALALAPAGAFAQSAAPQAASPAPAEPSGMSSPVAAPVPTPGGTIGTSPAPASSPASSGSGSGSSSGSGSGSSSGSGAAHGNGGPNGANNGNHYGQIKQIKKGTLSLSQVSYAVTHPLQEAKQLKSMKTIDFNKLRVYKLPSSLKGALKIGDAQAQAAVLAVLGTGVQIAQTTGLPTTNGNNSPIQYLRDVLANINVSNALNNLNVLNNSNVNVNVALSNVLNNNKISIGQVVGLYIGGGGIITTITK